MIKIAFLLTALLFILALRGLSSPKSAYMGMVFGILGMVIGVLASLFLMEKYNFFALTIVLFAGAVPGILIAKKIPMTSMPQLVAAFHSLVGLAAVLIAWSMLLSPMSFNINDGQFIKTSSLIELTIGNIIGAITFSASVIAFLKLNGNMSGKPILLPFRHIFNLFIIIAIILFTYFNSLALGDEKLFFIITALSLLIGILLIIPIGGADMPVIVSMLNSYSGWAAAGIGFSLSNVALIITGSLVGSSGAFLSYIMCKSMNRSFLSVLLGGFGGETDLAVSDMEGKTIKSAVASDVAFALQNAAKVIIVPGYGLAVARAQHAMKEIIDLLSEMDIEVKFAIHPVAGRMPGHMNVLLAEAQIDYEIIKEIDEINHEFSATDVVFVVGANDITNPSARDDKKSPIYGMQILNVDHAHQIYFVKRGMSSGYAGIENSLFYNDKTYMVFGDAKDMCENIVNELKK